MWHKNDSQEMRHGNAVDNMDETNARAQDVKRTMKVRDTRPREKKPPKPLDERRIKDLALHYVGKYATTQHKLKTYLARKLRERGWEGERPADIEALAARFVELGYIDDATFAAQKAASLTARGYGRRRVDEALYVAGISDDDGAEAKRAADAAQVESAIKMAKKRRFGPFAREPADPDKRRKQLQAMLRAGHDFSIARALIFADTLREISGLEPGSDYQEEMDSWDN